MLNANGMLSVYRNLDLGVAAQSVKDGAGQVAGWYLYNNASSVRYLKFYDKLSTGVAVASDTPLLTIGIPGSSGANVQFSEGVRFKTAIAVRACTGVGDTDNTAPTTNDVQVNLFYA